MSEWTFDSPTGTWRSPAASFDLLDKAMTEAGAERLWQAKLIGRHPIVRHLEFGRAVRSPVDLAALVPSLAACIRKVRFWVVPPHIRRDDDSRFVCSCGFRAPLPTEFGRVSPLRDHQVLYPDHTAVFTPRPGDTFAWYGVAAEVPEDYEIAPLSEGAPIPVEVV